MKIFFGFFNPFFLTVLDKGYNSIANAKNFLRMNLLTPEQIAIGTSLPLEQILELKKELETADVGAKSI